MFYSDSMSLRSNTKVRKRTALAQELLFGDVANGNSNDKEDMSKSYTIHDGRSLIPLSRIPSAPGSLK